MICPNCGNQNSDDVSQCTFCGQRFAPKDPAPDASQNYTQGNPSGNDYYSSGDQRTDSGSGSSQNYWQNPNGQNWNNQQQYNQDWNNQQNWNNGQGYPNNQGWNQQNNYQGWNNGQGYWSSQPPKPPKNTLGMVSMIIGIVSIVFCCFLPYLSIPLDIVAIVLGIIALRKPGGKGMAIAGIIIGAVILIAGIILLGMVAYFITTPEFQHYFNELYDSLWIIFK